MPASLPPLPWPRALDPVARLVIDELAAAPGAVIAAAHRAPDRWRSVLGLAGQLRPGGPLVDADTVFDLASVTKPFTALTAARLHRRSPLLDRPLGDLVPEASGTPSERLPLRLFLAHRAGLDAHRTLYAPLLQGLTVDRGAALREAALARRPDCAGDPPPEGFAPLYSDLGYLLAGAALERVGQRPLAALVRDEVTAPAGARIDAARSLHDAGHLHRVAPTELVPFRGGEVCAAVHDENAWALGGLDVCGHAGLFGTAPDLVRVGALLVEALADDQPAWLTAADLAPLIAPQSGGSLRMGFDGKSAEGSSAGALFGPRSFGHLGFTGTSLWIDPDRSLVAVLLTNRVHPTRDHLAIRAARPRVHDALARWADERGS